MVASPEEGKLVNEEDDSRSSTDSADAYVRRWNCDEGTMAFLQLGNGLRARLKTCGSSMLRMSECEVDMLGTRKSHNCSPTREKRELIVGTQRSFADVRDFVKREPCIAH